MNDAKKAASNEKSHLKMIKAEKKLKIARDTVCGVIRMTDMEYKSSTGMMKYVIYADANLKSSLASET